MDPNMIQQGGQNGMPQPGGMPQPVGEDQRQGLLSMIDAIQEKTNDFNSTSFAASNKTELLRRELLKQVFEKLQLAGVDLTDRASVSAFIARLAQKNPEMAAQFEAAMNALLGDPNSPPGFGSPEDFNKQVDLGVPPQNMNIQNENQDPSQNLPQSQ